MFPLSPEDLAISIAYFRVSTQKQYDEYSSWDSYYQRFKSMGFKDEQIYSDIGSGADNTRKDYLLVLDKIRNHNIKKVWIPSFDRLTRSPSGWESAMEDFRAAGAMLITLDGRQMSFTSPEDLHISRLSAAFAAYERDKTIYRVNKGLEFLRFAGKPFRAAFGYLKEEERLIPNTNLYRDTDKTVWQIARETVELFLECQELSETIKLLCERYGYDKPKRIDFNEFPRHHSSLRDWLKSATIRGHIEYFANRRYKNNPEKQKLRKIVYDTHQPLISEVEDAKIRHLLKVAAGARRNVSQLKNPLQGLLFCAGCGTPMKVSHSVTPVNKFDYIVCKSAYPNDSSIRAAQEKGLIPRCDRRSSYRLILETLEDAVIRALCEKAQQIASEVASDLPPEPEESPEIVELRSQIAAYEKMAKGDPDLLPLIEKKRGQLAKLLEEKYTPSPDIEELKREIAVFAQEKEFWMTASLAERMRIYSDFIKRVECDKGKVLVYFRF